MNSNNEPIKSLKSSWISQFNALIIKFIKSKIRNLKNETLILLVPLWMVVLMIILTFAIREAPNEIIYQKLPEFSFCQSISSDSQCIDVALSSPYEFLLNETLKQIHNYSPNRKLQTMSFDSSKSMEDYYLTHPNLFGLGLVINSSSVEMIGPNGPFYPYISYTIRMNESLIFPNEQGRSKLYDTSFLTLQNVIETSIININRNSFFLPSFNSTMYTSSFNHHLNNPISFIYSYYLIMALFPLWGQFLKEQIIEQLSGIKQYMTIIGVHPSAYFFSFFFLQLIVSTVISLLILIFIFLSRIFYYSNFGLFFLFFFLHNISDIALSFTLSPLVSIPETTEVVGFLKTVIMLLGLGISEYLILNDEIFIYLSFFLSILLPSIPFGHFINISVENELSLIGLTLENFFEGIFSPYYCMISLFLSIPLHIILAIISTHLKTKNICLNFSCFQNKKTIVESNDIKDIQENTTVIDPNLPEGDNIMTMENITMIYPDGYKSIDNLSCSQKSGEIFAILGHNGAGKSTLLKIVSGILTPTTGKGRFLEWDLFQDKEEIRTTMGMCSQNNTLFGQLTATEHIEFLIAIKNITLKNINELLESFDLHREGNKKVIDYSGGMKRKLTVLLSLIGSNSLILLDEPTTGVDVTSRRKIWNILESQKYKEKSVILLTSHDMEESDVLGNRIAIMQYGKINFLGSSLFFKNHYGLGYHLHLVKKNASIDESIINYTTKLIKNFVFDAYLETKNIFDIEISYILPLSSLNKFPQLFNHMENDNFWKENYQTFGLSQASLEDVFLEIAHKEEYKLLEGEYYQNYIEIQPETKLVESEIFIDQTQNVVPDSMKIKALFNTRIRLFRRSKKHICLVVIVPLIMLSAALIMTTAILSSFPEELLNPSTKSKITIPLISSVGLQDCQKIPYILSQDISQQKWNIFKNIFERYISPIFPSFPNFQNRKELFEWVISPKNKGNVCGGLQFSKYLDNPFLSNIELALIYNSSSSALLTLPTILNNVNNAFQYLSFSTSPFFSQTANFSFMAFFHPFPQITPFIDFNLYFDEQMFPAFSVYAFGFLMIFIAQLRVVDLEKKHKFLFLISGLEIRNYWISMFIADFCVYLFSIIISHILLLTFQIPVLFSSFFPLFFASFFFAFPLIPLSYLLSRLFKQERVASPVLSFFMAFLVFIPYFIIAFGLDNNPSTELLWILSSFLPTFTLFNSIRMIYIAYREYHPLSFIDIFQTDYPIFYLSLIMVCQGVFFMVLVVWIDKKVHTQNNTNYSKENDKNNIIVQNVRKEFTILNNNEPFIALKNISLNFSKGCFGLLGPNGAGKSTLIKIITGEISSTSGQIFICGYNAGSLEAQKIIGYCPQNDILYNELTVREHLELFSILKCGSTEEVDGLLQDCLLTSYKDVLIGKLSGGNRRKLSVALACCGHSKLILLDEPSTGMDPSMKHSMLDIINKIKKERMVLLTTHDMNEADILCHQICIITKGNIKALGTSQELKSKYGSGYLLQIKTHPSKSHEIIDAIKNSFSGASLTQNIASNLIFQMPFISLYNIFQFMSQDHIKSKIIDFSLSQNSLNQVFLKLQEEEEELI